MRKMNDGIKELIDAHNAQLDTLRITEVGTRAKIANKEGLVVGLEKGGKANNVDKINKMIASAKNKKDAQKVGEHVQISHMDGVIHGLEAAISKIRAERRAK